jgi:hypothetical protein
MPVVSKDWAYPASWCRAKMAWGVVREGADIRVCRLTRGGSAEVYVVPRTDWTPGGKVYDRLQEEKENGAWVAGGIEPHRLILREISSPIQDAKKASETWLSLFDAAIPFSLTSCHVYFLPLPKSPGESGSRCLAIGIRTQDLDPLEAEWKELGLDPELWVPEPLLISGEFETRIWCGKERTVWAFWRDKAFMGAGGSRDRGSRDRVLARQFLSYDIEDDARLRVGPDAKESENLLEMELAKSCFQPGPFAINLRPAERSPERFSSRRAQMELFTKVVALLSLLLLLLMPFVFSRVIQVQREKILQDIGQTFERITGYSNRQPGQEKRLAERFITDEWQGMRMEMERMKQPRVSQALTRILDEVIRQGLLIEDVVVDAGKLNLKVKGAQDAAAALAAELENMGWRLEEPVTGDGTSWQLNGEKP